MRNEHRKKWTDEEIHQAIWYRLGGKTTNEIAILLNRNQTTVSELLRRPEIEDEILEAQGL